jgi:hypothetical protein
MAASFSANHTKALFSLVPSVKMSFNDENSRRIINRLVIRSSVVSAGLHIVVTVELEELWSTAGLAEGALRVDDTGSRVGFETTAGAAEGLDTDPVATTGALVEVYVGDRVGVDFELLEEAGASEEVDNRAGVEVAVGDDPFDGDLVGPAADDLTGDFVEDDGFDEAAVLDPEFSLMLVG